MRMAFEYPVGQFTSHEGSLVAEASDLGLPIGNWPRQITVISADGAVTRYAWSTSNRDREGDMLYVEYLPVAASPAAAKKVVVFND